MLKAIIFDFDGVIVDTEKDRFKFIQKELAKQKIKINDSALEQIFGKKTLFALKELVPSISENQISEIYAKLQKHGTNKITRLKPLPNLKNLLQLLNKKYTLAIATGSKSKIVNKFLEYHQLQKYFKIITTGEQFNSSKPNPECYIMTLQKLKINSSEAIIIEDSQAGIIAGKKAKCKVFGLKNKYNITQLKKADKIFNNYIQMIDYFNQN